MELITENDKISKNNVSNIINNQSYSISQNNESPNNSFQLITKDPEKDDIPTIKTKEKEIEIESENSEIKDHSKKEEETTKKELYSNSLHSSNKYVLSTDLQEIKEIQENEPKKKRMKLNF